MQNEKQFVSGLRFNTPRDKAPTWIKGHISVKVEDFIAYAQANQDARGWLNIDVKESKGGNLYCELNTYGRDKGSNPPIGEPLPQQENDGIPF